jgi:hypothetical protein
VARGRYRIYYSAQARLRAERGQRVRGADDTIEVGVPDTLPAALFERFGFVADGVDLRSPATTSPRSRGS